VPESVQHLLDAHPFRVAFLVAAVTTVVLAAASLVLRRVAPKQAVLPLAGAGGAVAVVAGMRDAPNWSDDLAVGMLLLAAGGLAVTLLVAFVDWPLLIGAAVAVPGAVVLATDADVTGFDWAKTLSIVAIVAASALIADYDDYARPAGLAPVLLAATAIGVYYTVPDTEEAVVLVGATLPLVLLGFPFPFASLGRAGTFALVGAIVWVSCVDGRGRDTAIVGAIGCFGIMVLDPLLDRVLPERQERLVRPWSWPLLAMAAIHVGLVAMASRVAGTSDSLSRAVVILVVSFVVAAVALSVLPQVRVKDQRTRS
jgi:hypothetical protein